MPGDLDLSSFPLLRIDQVQRHETETLVESAAQLTELGEKAIAPFVCKLRACIRRELACRRGGEQSNGDASSGGSATPLPATSSFIRRENASAKQPLSAKTHTPPRRKQRPHSQPTSSPTPTPSFFVSNSPAASKTSNFRSRAKLAKASLHARSDEAVSQQRDEERQERSRQALVTMQDWRAEREKSKQQREALLAEEREQRWRRWQERKERERQVRSSMHAAAEEAKSMALEAGRTNEEAIFEAAAAAAKVVDDESTVFDTASADVDHDSFEDDDSIVGESLPSVAAEEDGTSADATAEEAQHDDSCSEVEAVSSPESESRSCDDCLLLLEPDAGQEQYEPCKGEASVAPPATTDLAEDQSEQSHLSDESETQQSDRSVPSSQDESVRDSAQSAVEETRPDDASLSQSEDESETAPPSVESLSDASTSQSADETIVREAPRPPLITAEADRKRLGSFPPFSDIFAKPSSGPGQKCSSEAKQRELTKSMHHQIARYTRASKDFAALSEPLSEPDDDSSDDYDTSFDRGLFYRINSSRPEVASIIHKAFSGRSLSSWDELPPEIEDSCWNLMWVWGLPKASDFEGLLAFQKVNRFRNTRGLTRKDLLKKHIQRCSKASARDGDSFNIMPLTYALPHEFNAFVSGHQSIQKVCRNAAPNLWILKPVGLSRGRGISLVDDIADVSYSQPIVIQRYVADPLCFMGYKFDLRMYVLVTSFGPLEAFVYKEGLARFGSRPYSLRPEFLHDPRVHLTNSSIQREFGDSIDRSHPAYLAGSNGAGNKVAFSWLFQRLKGLGLDTEQLWSQMVDVCRKALVAAGSDIPHQPNSFELFGFDLMFDTQLKCWLVEVNSSPSLGCDSQLDTRIKGALIRDTIELVSPLAFDRRVLADVCKRRMTHRKSATGGASEDVERILMSKQPRKHGEMPRRLGNFERIAPD